MWPFTKPPETHPAKVARRFHLAAVLSATSVPSGDNQPVCPPEADHSFKYTPLEVQDNSRLAGALETILQGQKVDPELFLKLYRGGYVFKNPGGQWQITSMGITLIERHKLLTEGGVLISGVVCKKSY